MSPNSCRSVFAAAAITAASAFAIAAPMRTVKEPALLSTERATYAILQDNQEVGKESFVRRVFDNNTIRFEVEHVLRNPAVTMTTKGELVLEEESYFPRSYRAEQTVTQPDDEFVHTVTVDMFANVAVMGSELRNTTSSRRIVVPAGIAIQTVGTVYQWFQVLFWIDPNGAGRHKFQWLDPSSGAVQSGEMYVAEPETIDVLGKKTKVTVYKAERERLGQAVLYVDAKKRIVKVEQNMMTYRLDQWSEELAKK
ncbi:MAG TPA: hypothetical protein VFU38_02360 [Candidatus Krumholzibacteria bacterium]|nr:hypothetical protein [Candidatus Krumholzibacteria bacterium]